MSDKLSLEVGPKSFKYGERGDIVKSGPVLMHYYITEKAIYSTG